MPLIYEPKGRAAEYSPLALSVYTRGCQHEYEYCFCRNMGPWAVMPHLRDLTGLGKEAAKASKQVLLSFMSDPYQPCEMTARITLHALNVLRDNRCSVAVLTKGAMRCIRDLEIFRDWPDGRIKVGATLTFLSAERSQAQEPGAASPQMRLEALRVLHGNAVNTWASIEPVIDPAESRAVIEASLLYVDAYAVGKLNHVANTTDWPAFGAKAVEMIRAAGKTLYVKNDLRAAMPGFEFRDAETKPETMWLPNRPAEKDLF